MVAAIQKLSERRMTLVALIVSIAVVRILAFTFLLQLDDLDPVDYWVSIPMSVASGQGYEGCNPTYFITCTEPIPTAAREPLSVYFYAILMRLFGFQAVPIFLAQTILDMAVGLLIYQIAMKVFSSRMIALASVALWSIYLPAISLTGDLNWGSVATFLTAVFVLSLVWMLERPEWRRFLLSGVCLGILCLSRSVYVAVFVLLIPGFLLMVKGQWKERLRNVIVFVIAAAVIVSPWVIRNYQLFHAFVPGTTLNGYNLFRHNWVIEDLSTLWYGDGLKTAAELRVRLADRLRGNENEVELDRLYTEEATKVIRHYPERYLELSLSRLADGWFNIRPAQTYKQDIVTFAFTVLVNGALWIFSIPALLIAPYAWFRRGWPLLAMLLYSTTVYLPVTIRMSYLVPVAPYLFMLGFYGLGVIWTNYRNHREKANALPRQA